MRMVNLNDQIGGNALQCPLISKNHHDANSYYDAIFVITTGTLGCDNLHYYQW